MPAAERARRAAFAVACLLYALALPGRVPPLEPCERPGERAARGGHTIAVQCDAPFPLPALRGPARRLFGLPLDPNRADASTLETLPGIGPARAAAIVRAREEGPFESVEALLRVPGVGPLTLSRIAPLLSVGAALPAPAGKSDSLPRTRVRSWEEGS